MSKQSINIGTAANDGTGEPLRTAFNKANLNFTELYNTGGWGFYVDGETTPATQSISTTAVKLLIDGLGATTETSYLPYPIRGTGNLWDVATNKITPISVGDTYRLRVIVEVTAKTGTPNVMDLALDIGGAATPTVIIATDTKALAKTAPFFETFNIPIFSLSTFLTNGGQLFLTTDTGTATISKRNIFLERVFKGDL